MDRQTRPLGLFASAIVGVAGLCAPLAALVAPASTASAQVTEVEPYYVVVRESNVNLRCGAGQVWYAVGKVDQGQVLRVDGHEFGWLRVGYPSGMAAVVKANDADFDSGLNAVTLIRESKLLASNPAGGVPDSWRQLLDEPLPTDTVLQHLETLRGSGGDVEGYRVVAPGGAKGYVSETLVRMATEEEVQRFLSAPIAQVPEQAPASTTPGNGATPIETEPTEAVAAKTAETLAEEARTAADEQVVSADENEDLAPIEQEPVREDAQVNRPAEQQPAQQTVNRFPPPAADAEPTEESAPAEVSQPIAAGNERVQTPETRTAAAPPPASYPDLNRAFEEVMRQPTEGAEYGPLINEFQRLLDTTPDEPGADALRTAARGRIEALKLRADLQASMQEMTEALSAAEQGSEEVQQRADSLDENPIYRFVGRLSSSTVYNGKRLPLLYRVQAVDSGRTVAYLTPDPQLDLTAKLGSVIGVVVKQSRDDSTLGLPLIDAKRVDVIKAERPR